MQLDRPGQAPTEVSGCASSLDILTDGAGALGLELSAEQISDFLSYCETLEEAAGKMNLTSLRTPPKIMRHLFLDALTVRIALPEGAVRHAGDTPYQVIDVGTGAGIPGLPLRIAHPHWNVCLVESVGKKARFLRDTIRALELSGVIVEGRRVEELGRELEWRDRADLAVARAVARLPSLIELCAPLVRPGGTLIFPKSAGLEAEIEQARAAERALSVQFDDLVHVPADIGVGPDRVLAVYRKIGPTSADYPRRTGLAQSRPLDGG